MSTLHHFELAVPVQPTDHSQGSHHAPVTLVEYGDLECPNCKAAAPAVKLMLSHFSGKLRFVFRHFPLSDMHPHAARAAEASEAAGAQGKFWEMHQMLFENQQNLSDAYLLAYAQAVGLDVARFTDDLATGASRPKVAEDFLSGVNSGVNGTPSFFINDVKHDGPWDAASLISALKKAQQPMHA